MRVFYVFNIKEEFVCLYKNNSSALYEILRRIYTLDSNDMCYVKTLLDQLENKFDKYEIDKYLFIKLHKEMPYSKRGEIHYMNDLYRDEVSKLIVKNRYIKILSDSKVSSFFKILRDINPNYFVCDFDNSLFFFIDSVKNTCLNA